MFSSKKYLRQRTPEGGIDRDQFIGLLAEEYYTTSSAEAKEQLTANLANFAYDPINYEYLKKHKILEIFLELLTSSNEKLIEHGCVGISNFCCDDQVREALLDDSNLELMRNLLHLNNENIRLQLLTIFALLINEGNKHKIITFNLKEQIQELIKTNRNLPPNRLTNYLQILREFF